MATIYLPKGDEGQFLLNELIAMWPQLTRWQKTKLAWRARWYMWRRMLWGI